MDFNAKPALIENGELGAPKLPRQTVPFVVYTTAPHPLLLSLIVVEGLVQLKYLFTLAHCFHFSVLFRVQLQEYGEQRNGCF